MLADLFQMLMWSERPNCIPDVVNSTRARAFAYMQMINLYWHVKTLMGRVLIDRVNTQQELIIYMVELLEKMDGMHGKVNMLIKRITNTDPSSSDTNGNP